MASISISVTVADANSSTQATVSVTPAVIRSQCNHHSLFGSQCNDHSVISDDGYHDSLYRFGGRSFLGNGGSGNAAGGAGAGGIVYIQY